MLEIAIDGHDGAAKTPILEGVQRQLRAQGFKVLTRAPFHVANHRHGSDVYALWEHDESTRVLLELLSNVISDARDEADQQEVDVLLWDRHWMTILGEIDDRSAVRPLWSDFVPMFFIQAPPSKTKACDRFSYALGWTSSDERIEDYYRRYLEIARRYPQHFLGTYEVRYKRQPLDPIITEIVAKILAKFR